MKLLVSDELWAVVEPVLPTAPSPARGGRPRIPNRAVLTGRLYRVLLDRLGDADQINWSRAALDSASIPAKKEAPRPGRIQRMARNRAPSALWWSTPAGSRSPRSSPPRM
jgi:hypothetical protein